jgi:hypothetical protein
MRLSDAGLCQRPTKLIYPDHRLTPWPNEDDTPRSLEPIVRRLAAVSQTTRPRALARATHATLALAQDRESSHVRFPACAPREVVERNPRQQIMCHPKCTTQRCRFGQDGAMRLAEVASENLWQRRSWRRRRQEPQVSQTWRRCLVVLAMRPCRLTMRLSDAGLRSRQTKLIYPDHRPSPWLIEVSAPRSLQPIVRS